MWSYTSTPPTCLHVVYTDSFTFLHFFRNIKQHGTDEKRALNNSLSTLTIWRRNFFFNF
jgi:hypothetical protein